MIQITGYKLVYDIHDGEKSVAELQAYDLPEYVRTAIDNYFDYLEIEMSDDEESEVEQ